MYFSSACLHAVAMDTRSDMQPIEHYVPTDLMGLLDDTTYFETHPTVSDLHATGTPLNAAAPPFRPATQRRVTQVDARPVRPAATTTRASTRVPRPLPLPASILPHSFVDLLATVPARETERVCREFMKFVTPSGPRRDGEGIDERSQNIKRTLVISNRAMMVQVSLLVAGFIIGPSGESIRSIVTQTETAIYSCTEFIQGQKCRIFVIEGASENMNRAFQIMSQAVNRYKELAEGKYQGLKVDRKQTVENIDFYYQPPPRSLVPFAASLRVERYRYSVEYFRE